MEVATPRDTKSAIMDSAEALMAEHGIDGVSLREILRHAHANPAALNYHFSTKHGLIRSILERRGHRIRVRRLDLLQALESTKNRPTIGDLIDAIGDPLLEFLHEEGESTRCFLRFLARLHSDRTGLIQRMERELSGDESDFAPRSHDGCVSPLRERAATPLEDTPGHPVRNSGERRCDV